MKLQNLKDKLSRIKLEDIFKFAFATMMIIVVVNGIFFFKNAHEHRLLMCISNAATFLVVGYHSILVLFAIYKKNYRKSVIYLLCIDLCTLSAYALCPLYIVVAFMNNQVDFVFPVGLCAFMIHFFILPTLRKWIE